MNPKYAKAYHNRGLAYLSKAEYDQAVRDFAKAIELNPDSVRAYNSLAWILATCPESQIRDGAEAVRLAERACGLGNNRVPALLDTLAAAYAETGQYDQAIKTAEGAVQLAKAAKDEELTEKILRRIELYKGRQPYHSQPSP